MANLARIPSAKVNDCAHALLSNAKFCDISFSCGLASLLRSKYRYRSENDEIVRTPEFMLCDLETLGYCEGDCDDVATLSCALCRAAGFSTRLVAIASLHDNPDHEFDHVFSECLTSNGWTIIDPTVDIGTMYDCYSIYYESV